MIPIKVIEEAAFQTIRRGATVISDDVRGAFARAIDMELSPIAKKGLEDTYKSMGLAELRDKPACPDTGWPIFYIKMGNEAVVEGGFMALEEAVRNAVRRATKAGYLRATMKHPLTGYDPAR